MEKFFNVTISKNDEQIFKESVLAKDKLEVLEKLLFKSEMFEGFTDIKIED